MAVVFVALNEAAVSGELLLVEGGLLRFHRRRDGVVTIREVVVLPGCRLRGVGRRLVDTVRTAYPGAVVRARCPVSYDGSNEFWRHMGFALASTADGVNVWECRT